MTTQTKLQHPTGYLIANHYLDQALRFDNEGCYNQAQNELYIAVQHLARKHPTLSISGPQRYPNHQWKVSLNGEVIINTPVFQDVVNQIKGLLVETK